MKICFVNTSLTSGGSERVMSIIASRLADIGHETKMLLVRDGLAPQYRYSANLQVVQLSYGTNNRIAVLMKRFIKVRRIIRKENPDVVISFMWDVNAFTLLCSLFLPVRVIVSERADPGSAKTRRLARLITERFIYRLADKIVLQTEYVKRYYPNSIQQKCVVIPNPVNSDLPQPYFGARQKEIVAAGRMTDQKNFKMLIHAFNTFYKEHQDWSLKIYGEGPMQKELKELTCALGVENAVQFPGFISDLPEKIREAGIYVNSSNFEGISNVMLEALAMGIPSVCTDCPVGGAALAIDNGKNGLLVPVGDVDALASSLNRLVADSELSRAFNQEAPKVRTRFSLDQICERWLNLCEGREGNNR